MTQVLKNTLLIFYYTLLLFYDDNFLEMFRQIVLVILTEINVSFRNNMQQHLLSMACQ